MVGLLATISAPALRQQPPFVYRYSTALDRRSTAGVKPGARFNRASAAGPLLGLVPVGAAVETLDRGFDWGSAAVGAGAGAAISLLLIALGAAVRGRRTGSSSRR